MRVFKKSVNYILMCKTIPFILLVIYNQIFEITDKSVQNLLGTSVIAAVGTVALIKWIVRIFSNSMLDGYIILLSQNKNKHNIRDKEISSLSSTVMFITILLNTLIISIFYFNTSIISNVFNLNQEVTKYIEYLLIANIMIEPINRLTLILERYLLINRKQKSIAIINTFYCVLNTLGNIFFYNMGYGLEGIMTSTFIATLIKYILLEYKTNLKISKPSLNIIKELFKLSKPLVTTRICDRLFLFLSFGLASMLGEMQYVYYVLVDDLSSIHQCILADGLAQANLVYLGEEVAKKKSKDKILKSFFNYIRYSSKFLYLLFIITTVISWFTMVVHTEVDFNNIWISYFILIPIMSLAKYYKHSYECYLKIIKRTDVLGKVIYILSIIRVILLGISFLIFKVFDINSLVLVVIPAVIEPIISIGIYRYNVNKLLSLQGDD